MYVMCSHDYSILKSFNILKYVSKYKHILVDIHKSVIEFKLSNIMQNNYLF